MTPEEREESAAQRKTELTVKRQEKRTLVHHHALQHYHDNRATLEKLVKEVRHFASVIASPDLTPCSSSTSTPAGARRSC